MPDEPLIFVQVALRRGLATEIGSLLDPDAPHEHEQADTAIFYSISNAQPGLAGISLGGFLIKRVVDELAAEFPRVKRFATLSPVPGLRRWVDASGSRATGRDTVALCAAYLLRAKRPDGRVLDPVANFHLSNGARIERINPDADPSARGQRQSFGIMVNYLYVLDEIEANHEAYASERTVAASAAVSRLARGADAA
jgi:malonyl-CoA decarboxylase